MTRLTKCASTVMALALSGCGACGDLLVPYCVENAPCYHDTLGVDIPKEAHIGTCMVGQVLCVDGAPTCVDAFYPVSEATPTTECDGLDNDCDGFVDEQAKDLLPMAEGNDCADTQCGVCKLAKKSCVAGGEWLCIPLLPPETEFCDGRDNDCDCETDEDLTQYTYPEEVFPGTVGVGECRPSVTYCDSGTTRTQPPVTPLEEVVCDGRDNDCDGVVDENDKEADPVALALVVDISGSMGIYAQGVLLATCELMAYSANVFVAIVLVSDQAVGQTPWISVLTDFVPVAAACAAANTGYLGTGVEYMWHGMGLTRALNWPIEVAEADRYIVLSTDEPVQSYLPSDETDALDACLSIPAKLIPFVYYGSDWTDLTLECGGTAVHGLGLDPRTTAATLARDANIEKDSCP